MEMQYDVFISYSRKNMELADKVEYSLKCRGLRCFIDRETIEIGEDFATKIAKSMYYSEVVLLLWTPESNQSDNVAKEIALADSYSKTIIPFQVGNFIPHYRLAYMLALLNRADKQQGFSDNQLEKLADWVIRSVNNSKEKRGVEEMPSHQLEPMVEQVRKEISAGQPESIYEQEYLLGCEKFRQYDLDQAFELLLEPAFEDYKDARRYVSYCILSDLRLRRIAEYKFEDLKSREEELNGNGFALYILGVYELNWRRDTVAAYSYAVKSMNAGSEYGTLLYVRCHTYGLGVDRNFKKVMPVLRRLALKGNVEAQSSYGRHLLYGWDCAKDIPLGLRLIREGADKGDMYCLRTLAEIYAGGIGVDKDQRQAEDIYMRLIDMGYVEAYSSLGRMYCYNDDSSVKDPESCRKGWSYLMKGAELGEPNCMYELAGVYDLGCCGEGNSKLAFKWYNRAAEAGLDRAYLVLGCVYWGTEDTWKIGVKVDYEKAWECFKEGARLDSWDCYYAMALMYYDGIAPKEITALDAVHYLQETVFGAGGSAGDAACRLYDIYHEGKIVHQDELKGIEYLKMAAEYESIEALVKLGKVLTSDVTSPYSDEICGLKYLTQAYEKGSVEAAIALARLSMKGVGTLRDREKAKEYLQFAIDEEESPEALCEMGKIFYQTPGFMLWDASYKDDSVPEAQKEVEQVIGIEYLKKAAEKQYAEAYLWLSYAADKKNEDLDPEGSEYIEGCKESLMYIKKGADLNHHQCLLDLAIYYAYGYNGVEQDYGKSEELFFKAMEAGSKQALTAITSIWVDSTASGFFPGRMSELYFNILSADSKGESVKHELYNIDKASSGFAEALEKDEELDVNIFVSCCLPRKLMIAEDSSYKIADFNLMGSDLMSDMHEACDNLLTYVNLRYGDLYSDEALIIKYIDKFRALIAISWKKLRSEVPELRQVTFYDHEKIREVAGDIVDEQASVALTSMVVLYLKLEELYKDINSQLNNKV